MHRIDKLRPMRISGSVTRDLSTMTQEACHASAMDLAQQLLNPAFLRLSDLVEEATLNTLARGFVDWVIQRPWWTLEVFQHLQSMCQTAAGEPLLSTWMRAETFWALLDEGRADVAIAAIAEQTSGWRALDLDEVYFDFHLIGSRHVYASEQAEPVAPDVIESQHRSTEPAADWAEFREPVTQC